MSLSRGEINKTLRAFTIASGLWGAWGQMVGMGTAVFTGYVLSVGADAADIAFFTSIAYFVAPTQYLASLLSRWISNKKGWIVFMGFFEALFRCLLIVIPYLFVPSLHNKMLLLFLTIGLVAGYMYSPFYSGWMASTVPANIRARFTSRQTIISTLCGMLAGVAAGGFVDQYAAGEQGFAFGVVFVIGTLFGWAGHALIYRAPYPDGPEEAGESHLENVFQPFKDRNFRRLIFFYASWNFAIGLSGPLFSVFMLERLKFSYTAISVFNSMGMLATMIGYQFWSGLIDRFGGKPVMQILLIPGALNALLWGLCQPGAYIMVGVAMLTSGIIMSGIQIAITPLLYNFLPEDNQHAKVSYLATWSTMNNFIYGFGPVIGGIVVASLKDFEWKIYGLVVYDIGILFFLSGVMRLLPLALIRKVEDTKAISSQILLSQMLRGNLLSYAFHNVMFNLTTAEDTRARAMRALGRSRNPMAIEKLIQSLSDASPKVRSQAARALGDSGSEEAIPSLIMELIDGESDIRAEAAEALGRLRHPETIGPLFDALEDPDPRVKTSAIRGLGEIGTEEVRDLLFFYMSNHFDLHTFPTYVDVLSNLRDFRIIKPALGYLGKYRSTAIRYQLLNSVCRALGAENQFYHYLSLEPGRRYDELEEKLKDLTRELNRSSVFSEEENEAVKKILDGIREAHDRNDSEALMGKAQAFARFIRERVTRSDAETDRTLAVSLALMAINTFLNVSGHEDLEAAREIFLVLCFGQIAELLPEE
jgi:predicted MFS family arabinose efflux permease